MRFLLPLLLCLSRLAFSSDQLTSMPVSLMRGGGQMLAVNGIQLNVLEKGAGPTILMLHGFPSYGGSWGAYLDRLSDQFHLLAPDMRGYNLSSKPEKKEDYQLEILMDDMIQLLKRVGSKNVCLVGHDWGGLISWYLAAHHPEIFTRLVILNAPHPKVYQSLYGKDPEQTLKAAYVPALLVPGSDKVLAFNNFQPLRSALFSTARYDFSLAEKDDILNAWRRGLKGPIDYYRAYIPRQKQLSQEMPKIKVPTLVLWGENDNALSLKNIRGLEAYVEQIEIKTYPDATHWVNYEKVDEISEEIRNFCAQ